MIRFHFSISSKISGFFSFPAACSVAKWCLTLCNLMDYSLPGSSVHGISQARILEGIAISFSRGSSWPRDWTRFSCLAGRFFTTETLGKPFFFSEPFKNWTKIEQTFLKEKFWVYRNVRRKELRFPYTPLPCTSCLTVTCSSHWWANFPGTSAESTLLPGGRQRFLEMLEFLSSTKKYKDICTFWQKPHMCNILNLFISKSIYKQHQFSLYCSF